MQEPPHDQVRDPMPGVVYAPPAQLRRYLEAGVLTRETMGEALRASFQRHADRVALCSAEGQSTYRELDELTDRLGAALLGLGLRPLDRVIFQIGNCSELVFALVACLKTGLIPVCTLAAHREQEIGYLGRHANARLHLVQGDDPKFDDVAFARRMRAEIPSMQWTLQARGTARDGALGLRALVESVSLEEAHALLAGLALDPFQVAVFQLSGGTTGIPKIIPRFHNEYVYNMRAVARFAGYRADDCLFMPMPMMHNLNMGCCFGPFLLTGGTVALATGLTPEALGQVFTRFQPTWTAMAGPIVEKLRPAIQSGALPLARLRGVISANNAPALRELLGAPVRHIFGMTEGVIMLTSQDDPPEVQDRMVGRPVSPLDEVRIFKPGTEEEITEPGVEGECVFAGPYTIHGYYDAAERNAETFTSQGYYRSGDLMLFRDIGGQRYYQFRGRTKDVVDRAGEKVNCEEVELLVTRHPAIAATGVVGMPDKVYGERICAFVTLREGASAPTPADLGAFLAQAGLARFKWPERIEVLPELPLTKSGKLSKPALKELIVQKLAAEAAA
ncbi:MAG TPA: AMP-binding protein [Ramlibacter sp.]|nr:AMP-binding protein [Ramlibacter sp.]